MLKEMVKRVIRWDRWKLARERSYERLYEIHARAHSGDDSVGNGPSDLVGRMELELLAMEGLRPGHTVVDLGCGVGRLAVLAVPYLGGGTYLGTDVSFTLLRKAMARVGRLDPAPACRVRWYHQLDAHFPVENGSCDFACAFSVFTHLEHEDTFLYLKDALRAVRPGGKFVFSCLPLDLAVARQFFLEEAGHPLGRRWARPRNVTTTVETMEALARLAGWEVVRWYRGDEPCVRLPGHEPLAFGQSCCVLQAP
jgi:SAM-dependent methyltransferase